MSKIICTLFLLCGITAVYAQSADSLYIKRGRVLQGTRVVPSKELKTMMADNSAAMAEWSRANSNAGGAQVLGFIGGFMIGWPLGTALGGGDPQWGLAAGGVAVLLLTIPLNQGFNKHASKAIQLYNKGDSTASFRPTLRFGLSGAGVKVALKF